MSNGIINKPSINNGIHAINSKHYTPLLSPLIHLLPSSFPLSHLPPLTLPFSSYKKNKIIQNNLIIIINNNKNIIRNNFVLNNTNNYSINSKHYIPLPPSPAPSPVPGCSAERGCGAVAADDNAETAAGFIYYIYLFIYFRHVI